MVLENEKWGVVSLDGELLVEPQYDDFENIKAGYIKVTAGGNVGVLNALGEVIVPVEFEECGTLESNKGTLIFVGHKDGEQFVFKEQSNVETSLEVYEEPEVDYILIKVKSTVVEDNNNNLYEAVRKAWRADLNKAKKYDYVLAVVDGVVRNVYTQLNWYDSSITGRIEFEGKECSENWVKNIIDKKIPAQYRQKGAANPFMYKK